MSCFQVVKGLVFDYFVYVLLLMAEKHQLILLLPCFPFTRSCFFHLKLVFEEMSTCSCLWLAVFTTCEACKFNGPFKIRQVLDMF